MDRVVHSKLSILDANFTPLELSAAPGVASFLAEVFPSLTYIGFRPDNEDTPPPEGDDSRDAWDSVRCLLWGLVEAVSDQDMDTDTGTD